MPEAPQPGMLEVNGLHFRTLSAGPEGGALVLLLHGFPQFADSWTEAMQALAAAGYRAVAFDQRGYSPGARPAAVEAYNVAHLCADALGVATALGAERFHLVGHDWGGLLAWLLAAQHPERLHSVAVLSTPHADAFLHALHTDPEQMWKSKYIALFKAPGHVAESLLLADDARRLREAYQGKVPAAQMDDNVRRLSEQGALTAALNWYRALPLSMKTGKVRVPTLYVWGDQDMALGVTAAADTGRFVEAPYRLERLAGRSHWLLEDAAEQVIPLLVEHVKLYSPR